VSKLAGAAVAEKTDPKSAVAHTRVAPMALSSSAPLPEGGQLREVRWFSEQVEVAGRLFSPAGVTGSHIAPGVILAPGWGETAQSLDAYAAALSGEGIVALVIDYRGWGRSGGFVYLNERVEVDDRQRFSQHTPDLVIRRGRLDPEHQVQDIRNAITFLQSEPGVDPARIGVLGVDIAGGHVIAVLAMDARVKAGVAVTPIIQGEGIERKSLIPSPQALAEMIRLARSRPPQTAAEGKTRNDVENELARAEYMPFWRADLIPATAAVQFIIAEADERVDNARHALAAQKAVKGPTEVHNLPRAKHRLTPQETQDAATIAAKWLSRVT
jgi:dienelactone hydrolase